MLRQIGPPRPKVFLSLSALLLIAISFIWHGCAPDWRSIDTPNGRRAIIEQANDFLTSGNCDRAIDVLTPLYESQYADVEVKMVLASAYACKGGFNFASLIASMQNVSGNDIWSALISGNYSSSNGDGKITYLQRAASLLRETTYQTNGYDAAYRPDDANVYMIFIQASLIGVTISTTAMGDAVQTTGKKRISINGKGTNADKCIVQVAVATIADCLTQVSTGTAIDSVSTSINAICGGACPVNKNPSVCTAAEQAQGLVLINAIDGQWSF